PAPRGTSFPACRPPEAELVCDRPAAVCRRRQHDAPVPPCRARGEPAARDCQHGTARGPEPGARPRQWPALQSRAAEEESDGVHPGCVLTCVFLTCAKVRQAFSLTALWIRASLAANQPAALPFDRSPARVLAVQSD